MFHLGNTVRPPRSFPEVETEGQKEEGHGQLVLPRPVSIPEENTGRVVVDMPNFTIMNIREILHGVLFEGKEYYTMLCLEANCTEHIVTDNTSKLIRSYIESYNKSSADSSLIASVSLQKLEELKRSNLLETNPCMCAEHCKR